VRLEQKQAEAVERLILEWASSTMNGESPEVVSAELREKIIAELARLRAEHNPEPNPVERFREGIRDVRVMMNRVGPRELYVQRRWHQCLDRAEEAILWWESGRGVVPGTTGMP